MSVSPYDQYGPYLGPGFRPQMPPPGTPPYVAPQTAPPIGLAKGSPKSTRAAKPAVTVTVHQPDDQGQPGGQAGQASPSVAVGPPQSAVQRANGTLQDMLNAAPVPTPKLPPPSIKMPNIPAAPPTATDQTLNETEPQLIKELAADRAHQADLYKELSQPIPQAQYKPPNKWLMLGSLFLALAGGPGTAGVLGAGLARGLYQGAQDRYKREENAITKQEAAKARQEQIYGSTIAHEGALYGTLAAIDERRQAATLAAQNTQERLSVEVQRYNQSYQLSSAALVSKVAYQNSYLSSLAAKGIISEQTAALSLNTRYQIAALQQSEADGRLSATIQGRMIAARMRVALGQYEKINSTINTEITNGANPQDVSAQAASATMMLNNNVRALTDQAAAIDPKLGALGAIVPGMPEGSVPGAAPAAPAASPTASPSPSPSASPSGNPNYTYPPALQKTTNPTATKSALLSSPIGKLIMNQQQRHATVHAAVQQLGVQGAGVPPDVLTSAEQQISQAVANNPESLGTSFTAFYEGLPPALSASVSPDQAEQLGDTWLNALAYHQVTQNSGAVVHHAVTNAQNAPPSGPPIPEKMLPAYHAIIGQLEQTQTQEAAQGHLDPATVSTPQMLDAQARQVLGLPANPDDENVVDRFLHFVFPPAPAQGPSEGDVQRLHALRSAGLSDKQIQQFAPELLHGNHEASGGPLSKDKHLQPMAHIVPRHFATEDAQPAASAQPTPEPRVAQLEHMPLLQTIEHIAKETPGLGSMGAPLVAAVLLNESGGDPNAHSPAGAIGYMQLMPGTAAGLGVNPHDPVENIKGGAMYLAKLLKMFHTIPLALAAYNAGPGAVTSRKWLTYPETTTYVAKVLNTYRSIIGQK